MHILVLIIGTALGVLFWLTRVGRGAGDVVDAAERLANLPRQRRHAKAVNRKGLALVETPIEAATILMLSIARMGEHRLISDDEKGRIRQQLEQHMQLEESDADGMVIQMDWLQHDIVLPESTLFPMVDILRDTIEKPDARKLADMMYAVADVHGRTQEQVEFVRRYRERMGLLA